MVFNFLKCTSTRTWQNWFKDEQQKKMPLKPSLFRTYSSKLILWGYELLFSLQITFAGYENCSQFTNLKNSKCNMLRERERERVES